VGALVVWAPLLIFVVLAAVLVCGLAAAYPVQALWVGIAASALHAGLFFKLRASVLGVPVSLFDLIPVVFLIAAIALRAQYPRERPQSALLTLVFWLSLVGLGVGVLIGLSADAQLYQIGRVVRIEAALLLALVATMMAAHIPRWREAVRASFYFAGVLMAIQIMVTFAWLEVVGTSPWTIFGLVDANDVRAAINGGSDIADRDLALNPFVMVPAFAFAAVRLLRRDILVIGLIVAATLLSVSRSAWFALAVAAISVGAFQLASRRSSFTLSVQTGVVIGVAAFVTTVAAGNVLSVRLDRSLSSTDASASYREAESREVFKRLTENPGTFLFGLGAGTIIQHPGMQIIPQTELSPLLENNVLSKWKNTTMLSLAAVVILLFGAFGRGWRRAQRKVSPSIYAMGLSLPALALSGLFGGTLNWVLFTAPLWLLAGTIVDSGSQLGDPETAKHA
jgi:hypothetical protein